MCTRGGFVSCQRPRYRRSFVHKNSASGTRSSCGLSISRITCRAKVYRVTTLGACVCVCFVECFIVCETNNNNTHNTFLLRGIRKTKTRPMKRRAKEIKIDLAPEEASHAPHRAIYMYIEEDHHRLVGLLTIGSCSATLNDVYCDLRFVPGLVPPRFSC